MSTLFTIYDVDTARQTILKRTPFDDMPVSPSIAQGIEAIFGELLTPDEVVRSIIRSVRTDGDDALLDWTQRIDRVTLNALQVPPSEITSSLDRVPAPIVTALQQAADRITRFYQQQTAASWQDTTADGTLGQLIRPIERVGIYVPGGTAPLPSSLLMSAIPARVAGVSEIIVCTPPDRDGRVPDVILAAAHIAGVEKVFSVGGAQAVAAMAFGTSTISQVDKIFGPGNLFVLLAKRQVFGVVGIDGLLGPTETLVIADEHARPDFIAADLLAQAEHDVVAQAILLTTSRILAEQVAAEIDRQAAKLSRSAQFRESLPNRGGAVIVPDLQTAVDLANQYAPEHLQLSIAKPDKWLDAIINAGAVFMGEHTFEVLGDYIAGPSHSLPTGGTARFSSGINIWDFLKITSVIALTPQAAAQLGEAACTLARAEKLDGHAAAVTIRRDAHEA